MTHPAPKAPIETKVKWSTWATYLGFLGLLAILNGVADANLISGLPDIAEIFLAPILPTLITFVSGYLAKHTPRTDGVSHL